MKATVTGLTGFIGRTLVSMLVGEGYALTPVAGMSGGDKVGVGNINEYTDWSAAMNGVDVAVHVVSRVVFLSSIDNRPAPELIRRLAAALECKSRLWSAPERFFRVVVRPARSYSELSRLFDSLQADISETCETLDWVLPIPVEGGLRRADTPLLA